MLSLLQSWGLQEDRKYQPTHFCHLSYVDILIIELLDKLYSSFYYVIIGYYQPFRFTLTLMIGKTILVTTARQRKLTLKSLKEKIQQAVLKLQETRNTTGTLQQWKKPQVFKRQIPTKLVPIMEFATYTLGQNNNKSLFRCVIKCYCHCKSTLKIGPFNCLPLMVRYCTSPKVIIHKSCGGVSLVEQDTIEYLSWLFKNQY